MHSRDLRDKTGVAGGRIVALASALGLGLGLAAGGLAYGLAPARSATAPASTTTTTTTPTAGAQTPGPTQTPSAPPSPTPAPSPPPPSPSPSPKPTPTRLTALPHPTIADGTAVLRVRLSGAPAASSPRPMITPAVAGSWTTVGDSEVFTPKSTLEPCSSYRLTVWSATVAVGHASLGERRTLALNVACPPTRALQQALARLGYLPYELHSRYRVRIAAGPESRALAARRAFAPPAGSLRASFRAAPPLADGSLDATTRGAVMVFQAAHGLPMTGVAERRTWASLLAAVTLDSHARTPYTFVTVSESSPETLEVHRGGRVVLSTPANTGVAGAETPHGIFPIVARYTATTMVGTNPDGTHYKDAGVPWVNYFNGGDAVHGFERASYGSPQSNGCVELPIATAHRVYRLLGIGDIVRVEG